mgnify:CR=1 FL=1
MATETERIHVLMTPAEKKRVVRKAALAGMKTSQFMREAADNYEPGRDHQALARLLDQLDVAADSIGRSVNDCMAYVTASNQRIEVMEAEARGRDGQKRI